MRTNILLMLVYLDWFRVANNPSAALSLLNLLQRGLVKDLTSLSPSYHAEALLPLVRGLIEATKSGDNETYAALLQQALDVASQFEKEDPGVPVDPQEVKDFLSSDPDHPGASALFALLLSGLIPESYVGSRGSTKKSRNFLTRVTDIKKAFLAQDPQKGCEMLDMLLLDFPYESATRNHVVALTVFKTLMTCA